VLYNGLAYRATASIEEVVQRAMDVEAAAHAVYKDTPEYRNKIRGLMTSLKRKDNPELGRRVLRGDITPERFVTMTDEELASDAQRARDRELERENMLKAQVPMAQKSISDSLQCGKCKEKKVSYSQAQTRSADEPMTTFCECTVCGNRWKVRAPLWWLSCAAPVNFGSSSRKPWAIAFFVLLLLPLYFNCPSGQRRKGRLISGPIRAGQGVLHYEMCTSDRDHLAPVKGVEARSIGARVLRS
jgi:DNA-directed RNA polymerase subunit M/transcription elongation factor TFIIS